MRGATAVLCGALLIGLSHGYPWGAPESTCTTGSIPGSHGGLSAGIPPFVTRLYTTYTSTDITSRGWITNRSYDLELETTSTQFYSIAGYLIHDLANTTGGSFATVDYTVSADDHFGLARSYVPAPSQLRCQGNGVTHASAAGNTTVLALDSVRFSIRAPADPTVTQWSIRFSVLTMPVAPTGSPPYTTWPGSGNVTTYPGRAFVFTRTFQRRVAPTVPACAAVPSVQSCTLPLSSGRACYLDDTIRRCAVVGGTAVAVLGGSRIAIGGRDVVVSVPSSFASTGMMSSFTTLGDARLVASVTAAQASTTETVVLVCGVGDGRPRCEYRSAANVSSRITSPSQWLATGVVPRSASASYGLLAADGSVYSGHYQLDVPGSSNVDANLVSRSLLSDTTNWDYRYTHQGTTANNGLYRSTPVPPSRSEWLQQPGTAHRQALFTTPWMRNATDPYVYFGITEPVGTSNWASRIARVCRTESATPDGNHFNSFLLMDLDCGWSTNVSKTYSVGELVTAASGSDWMYASFTTPGSGTQICAFSYSQQPAGINYEMGGRINSVVANSLESLLGIDPTFDCNRSSAVARQLYYVSPTNTPTNHSGKAQSPGVMWAIDGANNSITALAVHTETLGTLDVDVIWATDASGRLLKVRVGSNRSEPFTTVQSYDIGHVGKSLTVDTDGRAVLVGAEQGVTRVPFGSCAHQTTCNSCTQPGDPYCGWCTGSRQCTASSACASGPWVHTLNTSTTCVVPPPIAQVRVINYTATNASLQVTVTGDSLSTGVTLSVRVRPGTQTINVTSTPANLTVASLTPYTLYTFTAVTSSVGGITPSIPVQIQTSEAAPSVMDPASLTAVNSTAVSVAWSPPEVPNGILGRYRVRRNGTLVCCDAGVVNTTAFVDTGLSPYTVYSYTVSAGTGESGVLEGVESNATMVRTLGTVPTQVGVPTCGAVTDTTLAIAWNASEPPNGVIEAYLVYINGTRQWQVTASTSLTYVATGLTPYSWYNMSIVAVSSFGASVPSAGAVCRTAIAVPAMLASPQAQLVTTNTSTVANVSWAASADAFPVLGYKVTVTTPGATTLTDVYRGTGTSVTVPSLLPCTLYYVAVRAFTSAGDGPPSIATRLQTGAPRPLPTPSALQLSSWTNVQVTVRWSASTCNVRRHLVQRRETHLTNGVQSWTIVCCSPTQTSIGGNVFEDTFASLNPESSYEFSRAEMYSNSDGTVAQSAWSVSTTLQARLVPTPAPTAAPTDAPTVSPTRPPTPSPTHQPSYTPTTQPTRVPTTLAPTTLAPTTSPTMDGRTYSPTGQPTEGPTRVTGSPVARPTSAPTRTPTLQPTRHHCDAGTHLCDPASTYCAAALPFGTNAYSCECLSGFDRIPNNATQCSMDTPPPSVTPSSASPTTTSGTTRGPTVGTDTGCTCAPSPSPVPTRAPTADSNDEGAVIAGAASCDSRSGLLGAVIFLTLLLFCVVLLAVLLYLKLHRAQEFNRAQTAKAWSSPPQTFDNRASIVATGAVGRDNLDYLNIVGMDEPDSPPLSDADVARNVVVNGVRYYPPVGQPAYRNASPNGPTRVERPDSLLENEAMTVARMHALHRQRVMQGLENVSFNQSPRSAAATPGRHPTSPGAAAAETKF
eukprot:m.174227 g.174227  ORF g.174227 m.174227 type:complete len:1619 (+) comp13802_c0_seq1:40-4896(+)